jgi:uncharacterized membrane-anchored protein YjiN (DUF445 family)
MQSRTPAALSAPRAPAPRWAAEPGGAVDAARPLRRLATGLLVLMAAIFVVANHYASAYPALGYVRAFAEASMVGGLADWFAVTALFRHPLGLPIPHTAIVPNNKERIANTIGRFLRTNFLVPHVIARRLDGLDLAGAVARRLAQPQGGGRLRQGFRALARQLLTAVDDAAITAMVRGSVDRRLRGFDIASALGGAIERAIENRRHGALVDAGLRWMSKALADNESLIRDQVRERTSWVMRLAGIDSTIADQIISALNTTLRELATDPAHPMRLKATESLVGLAFDLKHDAVLRAKVESLRDEVLSHPAVTDYLDGLWVSVKDGLMRATDDPALLSEGPIGATLRRLGASVESDPAIREQINAYARRAIVGAVASYGDSIAAIVSDTVKGWDTGVITAKLEGVVGRDLQYIRMNGTIVGGLAGLTIYTLSQLIG